MSTTLPPLPVYPGPNASDADLARFRADLDVYRAAASAIHGEAQANTAVAMADAAAAQRETAQVLAQPMPPSKPTRFSVAVRIAEHLSGRPIPALSSAPSPSTIASTAKATVDALAALYPGAMED